MINETMFTVLYSWKIKPGLEEQFIEGWEEVTKYHLENSDSLGSRLLRGNNGKFYACAQWKTSEQRARAFESVPDLVGGKKMREAVEERFEPIEFEILSDLLKIA
jgi:heme-degrading monooxygenase HmoA